MTGEVGRLDRRLGALLQELAKGGAGELLARTTARLVAARREGSTCLLLSELAGTGAEDGSPWPAVDAWREGLLGTGLVGGAGEPRPLVLADGDRLQLRRDHVAETRLAAEVRRRLQAGPRVAAAEVSGPLRELFPDQGEVDWQAVAAAAALRGSLTVITGGPGTGKTTTVARLLALLLRLQPGLRCGLAAPTGKAAARMEEALGQQVDALGLDPRRFQPTTLHRLLGYLPVEDAFRYGRDRRLALDLVVLDEASMVDLSLMDALLQALRPDARLVLLGDRDQLASVAAGQVLGDLCGAAKPEQGAGPALAAFAGEALGRTLPVQAAPAPLAEAVVLLRRSWRFSGQPGLDAFAGAMARRDAAAAAAALAAGHSDLRLLPAQPVAELLAAHAGALAAVAEAADPAAALRRLAGFRVLTALRQGPLGTEGVNLAVEELLRRRGLPLPGPWYRGRPVLVTANDPRSQLVNGDVGVCWSDGGAPAVWFPEPSGGLRPVSPLRLPPHETAWSLTVHKAQGSEFDEVLVILPDRENPLLQAPLVYTAVTRARTRASLCADGQLLAAALAHWPARLGGLAAALQSSDQASGPGVSMPADPL